MRRGEACAKCAGVEQRGKEVGRKGCTVLIWVGTEVGRKGCTMLTWAGKRGEGCGKVSMVDRRVVVSIVVSMVMHEMWEWGSEGWSS